MIDGQSLAVVAYHDVALLVDVEGRDVSVARQTDMGKTLALQSEQSGIGRANVDMIVAVDTYAAQCVPLLVVVEVPFRRLAVIAPQSLAVGDQPETSLLVFSHAVYGMQVAQGSSHLVSRLTVGHAQQSVACRAHHHLAVLP